MKWRREHWALLAILALAAVLRLGQLGSDVPFSAEGTQAPVLDAFWYLEAAAGPAEGSVPRFEVYYDLPVWSSLGRVWFAVFGVSLASAQALGAILALACVLLLWRVLRVSLGSRAALLGAAVLAVLYPYVTLSRTTLIYGPVTLGLLVAAAVWLRARARSGISRWAHQAAAWGVVLALGAVVRPPALALAGGLLLAQIQRSKWLRRPAALGAGLAVLTVITLLVLPGSGEWILECVSELGGVFAENVVRLRRKLSGSLTGELLLGRAFEWGFAPTAGGSPGFAVLAPGATGVAIVGCALAWGDWTRLTAARRETLLLFFGWGVAFVGGSLFMEAQARALRYYMILAPSVAALAAYVAASPPRPSELAWLPGLAGDAAAPEFGPVAAGGGFDRRVGVGVAVCGAFFWPFFSTLTFGASESVFLRALAGSLMAIFGWVVIAVWGRSALRDQMRRLLVPAAVVAAVLPGLARSVGPLRSPTWWMKDANTACASMLDPETVVLVGPYASVLSIGNRFQRSRATWIDTSTSTLDATLDGLRLPKGATPLAVGATHIALDEQQEFASALIGWLGKSGYELTLVAVVQVRPQGPKVLILRFPWASSAGYALTHFERRRLADDKHGLGAPEADRRLLTARASALVYQGKPDAARLLWRLSLPAR